MRVLCWEFFYSFYYVWSKSFTEGKDMDEGEGEGEEEGDSRVLCESTLHSKSA